MSVRLPRCVALVVWLAEIGTAHVIAPLRLSQRGQRHGWRDGRPGPANLVGVAPLAAGAVLVAWPGVRHFRAMPGKSFVVWPLPRTPSGELAYAPEYLLTDGPYRFSRNPMHVGGLSVWAGWAILLGSQPVARVLAAATALLPMGVAWEEQGLARRFGDEWGAYAARTPRWIGLSRVAQGRGARARAAPRPR
jgi:protein-S-isoprenylcysteine O-methyltransferase Ste14